MWSSDEQEIYQSMTSKHYLHSPHGETSSWSALGLETHSLHPPLLIFLYSTPRMAQDTLAFTLQEFHAALVGTPPLFRPILGTSHQTAPAPGKSSLKGRFLLSAAAVLASRGSSLATFSKSGIIRPMICSPVCYVPEPILNLFLSFSLPCCCSQKSPLDPSESLIAKKAQGRRVCPGRRGKRMAELNARMTLCTRGWQVTHVYQHFPVRICS